MLVPITLRAHHFEILASFSSDIAAGWFITAWGAREDLGVLTANLFLCILALIAAFKLKVISEDLRGL